MPFADELRKQLEEVGYPSVYEDIKRLFFAAVSRGEKTISLSYKYFKGNNALIQYIIQRCIEDDFYLRLYETKMEIRLEE